MSLVKYSETNLPSANEIREDWCFGLPLTKEDGVEMPDRDIEQKIRSAISLIERKLGIYLKPMVIMSNPDERGFVEGEDYDIEEPPYDYDAKAYARWGFLQLRERPVQSLKTVQLVLPNGQIIVDFLQRPEWVKLYRKQAQIHIVPYAGDPTLFYLLGGSQTGYPFITGQLNRSMPQMWYIDYVAGYPKNKIPADIRNAVAKTVAIDILGIAGDAILAGVASLSTSIDGLSESFSTTASATNATYGAHILQYQKELDTLFSEKEDGAGVRSSERGLTFTVL